MLTEGSGSAAEGTAAVAYNRGKVIACALVGVALCVAALGVAGYELATFMRMGRYDAITAGRLWFALHVPSLNLLQAVIQRYIDPRLWDPLLVSALRWPLWSLLGGTGLMLVTPFAARRQ